LGREGGVGELLDRPRRLFEHVGGHGQGRSGGQGCRDGVAGSCADPGVFVVEDGFGEEHPVAQLGHRDLARPPPERGDDVEQQLVGQRARRALPSRARPIL
jgi:hypothetical protein